MSKKLALCSLLCALLSACNPAYRGGNSDVKASGADDLIGTSVGKGSNPEYDAMIERQRKDAERQKQEMEDIERQKYYNDKYRRFERNHKRAE